MDAETLELLKRLGLNQYESKAYSSLQRKGTLTAASTAIAAQIPRPRAYDVLESLVSRGFATISPGRPVKYNAVTIQEAAENAKKTHAEQHEKKLAEIEHAKKRLAEKLKKTEPKQDSSETAWLLHGHKAINSKLETMVSQARQNILISTTAQGLQRKLAVLEDTLHEAKRRGVNTRIICPAAAQLAERAAKFGEVTQRRVQHRLVVVDDHALLFLTPEDADRETCVLIKSPYLTQNLQKLL